MPIYRVLIVDDSAFMRKVFSDRIDADDDFTVASTASDGEEAIRLAQSLEPDIITMDLEMPRMNGLEALRRIMALRPTPIIMLSAITDNGTRDTIKALQYGAFDFIHKPDTSVRLDIRQVGDELLDKLRIAMESVKKGTFRMLPAVEETGTSLSETNGKQAGIAGQEQLPLPEHLFGGLPEPPQPSEPKLSPKDELPQTPHMPVNPETAGKARVKPESRDAASETGHRTPRFIPKSSPQEVKANSQTKNRPSAKFTQIVAVGTSTGGPRALHELLTGLPGNFEAPLLVVQHMPPKFTLSLAQRLDSFCAIRVREATEGEKVETATAYIAPGGKQMSLSKDSSGTYRIKLTQDGPRSGHMPSVDVLFESLVGHRQLNRHIVLMTGMGSDGAKGMKALQEDGAQTRIAEAEETCVVYGMPRSAVELGAVTHQLPLQRIAPILVHEVNSRHK
jgi:two-component system, chemotaxis family, protein-glutamate methylesterase/glutaminase